MLGKDEVTSSTLVISSIFGCVARLARAFGSYPECQEFKSLRSHHLKVRTVCLILSGGGSFAILS